MPIGTPMALQERSTYMFPVSCSTEEIEELMQNWLVEHHFEYVEESGHIYYQCHRRCMEYRMEKDQVILDVYLKQRNRTIGLENGLVGMMDAMSYINILTPLFTELNNRG